MIQSKEKGSTWEVFKSFLILGLTSFGGPIAHLGYFRTQFVTRQKWLSEQNYADLVALCQFLPGPTSSQVGFAIGLQQTGIRGAIAAWTAFTLPSVALLLIFTYSMTTLSGPLGQGLIHGLKLVAVSVVAQAVWEMARKLCPDLKRISIAMGAILIIVLLPTAMGQIGAIMFGTLAGLWLCKNLKPREIGYLYFKITKRTARIALLIFFILLISLPLLAISTNSHAVALFEAFYRAGSLVFGGGHVVLPLLETSVVGNEWVSTENFLMGYGAAQAIPGPLFTFAAYLGAIVNLEPSGPLGAAIALLAIFLPGMLLLIGILPYWGNLRKKNGAQAAMAGANAAVVGILGAALYDPVYKGAVFSSIDIAIALTAFLLLTVLKLPSWIVVLMTTFAGMLTFVAI